MSMIYVSMLTTIEIIINLKNYNLPTYQPELLQEGVLAMFYGELGMVSTPGNLRRVMLDLKFL